jgi:hypothetical protein
MNHPALYKRTTAVMNSSDEEGGGGYIDHKH